MLQCIAWTSCAFSYPHCPYVIFWISLETDFLPLRFIWYILRVVVSFGSVKLFPRGFVSKQNCSLTVIHFSCFEHKRAFLALLFPKKTSRYCHTLSSSSAASCRKLWHFLIPLSLVKIFTWNIDQLFIFKRGTHTRRAGEPIFFFFFFFFLPWYCPFSTYIFFNSNCSRPLRWHPRAVFLFEYNLNMLASFQQ